jgi:beta-barrel assembly-enhancing protease
MRNRSTRSCRSFRIRRSIVTSTCSGTRSRNVPTTEAFSTGSSSSTLGRSTRSRLIERTNTLSQFAGVLGHEIGHVVRRHSVQQMQKAQGANFGVVLACVLTSICNSDVGQTAINVGGTAIFAKFSRDDENEADQEAIRNVIRAGIHPRGIPEMFQILINERNRQASAVESWFATHPLEESRVENTRRAIEQIDPAILRNLTTDSQNFHSFRNRVRALPAPPAANR